MSMKQHVSHVSRETETERDRETERRVRRANVFYLRAQTESHRNGSIIGRLLVDYWGARKVYRCSTFERMIRASDRYSLGRMIRDESEATRRDQARALAQLTL